MDKITFFTKNIYTWSFVWIAIVIYYAISINYGHDQKNADYVAYLAQLLADLSVGIFSFLAYHKANDDISKKFLLLMFVSIAIGLGGNEIYNFLFNVIKIKSINSEINITWMLLYTLLLIGQISAWSYLLYKNRSRDKASSEISFTRLPFLQFSVMVALTILILTTFIMSIFKNEIPRSVEILQTLNTALETILFVILSISLSKSKTRSLSFLATGFLLMIAFNIAQRFSYMTGHFYKTFDVAWLGCYLFAIFGFIYFIENKDEKFEFFEQNSLYVLTSAIFSLFSSLIFLVFIALEFFITSLEIDRLSQVKILLENVPSILIFSLTLSVLFSKVVGTRLSKPLEMVSNRIDLIQEKKLDPSKIPCEKFDIYEIDKLDKFILKTMAQLQAANRVKSEFLMNMSHDLRTPASGVHSMAKLVHEKISDIKLKRLQKLIVDSSRQLLDLLDGVLDYSKSESDSAQLKLSKIDIRDLINDIILFMGAKAAEKELGIHSYLPDSPITYCGDRVVLHRILVNIISNAIKFTHYGNITISAYEEQLSGSINAIKIIIKDTGIGIDKQYHEAIFDPFFRIDSTESKYGGVGLGLSNVRLMLNKLGGKVYVDSDLGKGAIFTIYLSVSN